MSVDSAERANAIKGVTIIIEDALSGYEDFTSDWLARQIVDFLRPPHQRPPNGASSSSSNVIPFGRPKPRIRVRAATQHTA